MQRIIQPDTGWMEELSLSVWLKYNSNLAQHNFVFPYLLQTEPEFIVLWNCIWMNLYSWFRSKFDIGLCEFSIAVYTLWNYFDCME